MKIELGKTYIDRDGCKVRIIATDVKHEKHTIAGIQTKAEGSEEIVSYYTDGRFTRGISGYDLQREATIYDDFKQGDLVLSSSPDVDTEILWVVSQISAYGELLLRAFSSPNSPRCIYVPEDGGSLKVLMTAKEWDDVLKARNFT